MKGQRAPVLVALVVLVAACLAALIYWIVSGAQHEQAIAAARAAEERAAEARAGALAGAGDTDFADAKPAAEIAPERAALPAESSTGTSAAGVEILVLERATGLPVPGAEVRRRELAQGGPDLPWNAPERADALVAGLAAVHADPQGRVRVTAMKRESLLVGTAAGLWGWITLPSGAPPLVKLELDPDGELLVRCVDASGSLVAGAPVALRRVSSSWFNDLRTLATDAAGLARFPHAANVLASQAPPLFAALAGVYEPLPKVELDPRQLPRLTLELVVPASGAVAIEVADADGRPCGDDVQVGLRTAVDLDQSGDVQAWMLPRGLERPCTAGRVLYEHVGLGLDLVASARRGNSHAPIRIAGPGPRKSGEIVAWKLAFGAQAPVIEGRVVHQRGDPAQLDLHAQLVQPGTVDFDLIASFKPDASGRFRIDLARDPTDVPGRKLRIFTQRLQGLAGYGEAPLPLRLEAGLIQVGDVVMRPAPLVASGTVRDESGQPVANARIALSVPAGSSSGWWRDLWWFDDATSGANGRFELRMALDVGRVQLAASLAGLQGAPVECDVGAQDVELRLVRAGRLRGWVVLDEPWTGGDVRLRYQRQRAPGEPFEHDTYWKQAHLDKRLHFDEDGLAPGSYNLELAFGWSGKPLAELAGVAVPVEAASADPRLAPIDLRGKVAGARLRIVDAEGEPVNQGDVRWWPSGEPESSNRLSFQQGRCEILARRAPLDLVVEADGYRSLQLERVEGERTLALERALRVRIALADASLLPAPPWFVRPFLAVEGGSDRGSHQSACFAADGVVELWAPGPGSYRVAWGVELRSPSTTSYQWSTPSPACTLIEVREDAGAVQAFTVELDRAAVDEVIKSMQENL